MTTNSISVVEGLVVIYQRERSSVWQVRVKLDDKRWHRHSTGEHDEKKAAKAAIKLFYDKEFKRESKLPQSNRKFGAVANAVVKELQAAVDNGIANTAAATQLLDRHACFGLPQEPNDLFVGKSALLHARHSSWGRTSQTLGWYGWQGTGHI